MAIVPPRITLDRVRQVASDLFDAPYEQLSADSSPETLGAWDSMQHLNLVLALEQEFDLMFAAEEIERMRTLGSIATLIDEKLASTL